MSGKEKENPKESEELDGEVQENTQGHTVRGNSRSKKRKGNKENCLYKGEEVFIDYNTKGGG